MFEDKEFEAFVNALSQDVSFKLGDMILSYPPILRPLVLATVQACLNAQMGSMPDKDRELYEASLSKMTVVTIPQSMDPRKKGGAAK